MVFVVVFFFKQVVGRYIKQGTLWRRAVCNNQSQNISSMPFDCVFYCISMLAKQCNTFCLVQGPLLNLAICYNLQHRSHRKEPELHLSRNRICRNLHKQTCTHAQIFMHERTFTHAHKHVKSRTHACDTNSIAFEEAREAQADVREGEEKQLGREIVNF